MLLKKYDKLFTTEISLAFDQRKRTRNDGKKEDARFRKYKTQPYIVGCIFHNL